MNTFSARRHADFWQLMRKWFKREHTEIEKSIGAPATDADIYAMFPGAVNPDGYLVIDGRINENGYYEADFTIDNGIIIFN